MFDVGELAKLITITEVLTAQNASKNIFQVKRKNLQSANMFSAQVSTMITPAKTSQAAAKPPCMQLIQLHLSHFINLEQRVCSTHATTQLKWEALSIQSTQRARSSAPWCLMLDVIHQINNNTITVLHAVCKHVVYWLSSVTGFQQWTRSNMQPETLCSVALVRKFCHIFRW